MSAFVHSKSSRIFLNSKHISCQVTGFTDAFERDLSDSTVLCDAGNRFVPGLQKGSVSIKALFEAVDVVNGTLFDTLNATRGVNNSVLVTSLPAGYATIGTPAFITVADPSSFEVSSAVADVTSMSYEATSDNGNDWGVLLHPFQAETASGNSASVDNLALTSGGGAASLHVTTVAGTTPSATIKIQHSTDNSVWVDLITFTAATAATSEFKTVTGTVNRYTRCLWTISGTTPSFTFAAAFARR